MKRTVDDDWFTNASKLSLSEYIDLRATWSSRVIPEIIIYYFCKMPNFCFMLANSLVFCGLVFTMAYLFNDSGRAWVNWVLVFLLALVPFNACISAGWIATMLNYTWPITAFFACMIPVKWFLTGKKMRWYLYLLFVPAAIFCADVELFCSVLLFMAVCLIGYAVLMFVLDKKRGTKTRNPATQISRNIYNVILLAISAAGIIFHMTHEGNKGRLAADDYSYGLGLFDLPAHIASTGIHMVEILVFYSALLLIAFSLVVLIAVFRTSKNHWRVLTVGSVIALFLLIFIEGQVHEYTFEGRVLSTRGFAADLFFIAGACFVLAVLCLNIYLIFGNSWKSMLILLVLSLGFLSPISAAVGGVSLDATRTAILLWFCVAGAGAFICSHIAGLKK